MLSAGAAKRRVTPPVWVPYLTSSGRGTCAPFEGVHDDLYARALVLDDGTQSIAVLAVDSIGYDNAILGLQRDFTGEVRSRIAAATGIEGDAVMLTATHSHSTPETIGLTPFRELSGIPEWLEGHLEDLVAVAVKAWERRVPVRAYAGAREVAGVARHRRIVLVNREVNRRGPLPPESEVAIPWERDEVLSVLYLETEEGTPCALLLNFTAHPVVAMLLPWVSADYPGAATVCVEEALEGAVCLFTNGAAGNVNSAQVATSFQDVEAIGQTLGRAALAEVSRLKEGHSLAEIGTGVCSEVAVLDPGPCPSMAETDQAVAADPSCENLRIHRLARKLAEGPIRAEVQAMGLGPLRWVSLPGEAFVETGLALKREGASFVVGYANGWVGYLPIRRAYDEGGYEVEVGPWSRVAPGSAERLEEVGKGLLKRLGEKGDVSPGRPPNDNKGLPKGANLDIL